MEYELYHHGVKGMKWGVRKKRDGYTTARQAHKNAKAAGDQAAKDAINRMNASPKKHTLREYNNAAKKAKRQAEMDSFRDAKDRNKQKRAEKKAADAAKTNAAIKDYRKKFDSAEKASNLADEKWNQVSEQYTALGKNKVQRILNAARNKTAEAKKYSKMYDEASDASDFADTLWNETRAAYKETGKNAVSRILNQINYDKQNGLKLNRDEG